MFLFLWKYEKNSHWLLDRDFIPNLKRLYCCLVKYMPSIVLNRIGTMSRKRTPKIDKF